MILSNRKESRTLFYQLLQTDRISYDRHVRPILSDKCFFCHGPDEPNNKAGLRLDVPELAYAALKESKGHAIVPGNAEQSVAIQRIYSTDPHEIMPPPDSHRVLTEEEKNILSVWVNQGALPAIDFSSGGHIFHNELSQRI